MSPPLISIVIPTFNRASDLRRALASVRAQTYSHWEALVVDNYSTDDTDQAVADLNDPRVRIFKIHNDGVVAASRNVGIANASGEFVAFLDSDDWWTPTKLADAIRVMEAGADVVYHDLYLVTKRNQRRFFRYTRSRHLTSPAARDLIENGNTIGTSSVVVRKTVLDGIGRLREDRDLVTWEDYDAWIRLAQATERVQLINKCLGYCWRGGGNLLTATQVLSNITAFERRYAAGHDITWTYYTRGRSSYFLGDYTSAISYFFQTLRKDVPIGVKLRVVVLIAMSAFRRAIRGDTKTTALSEKGARP